MTVWADLQPEGRPVRIPTLADKLGVPDYTPLRFTEGGAPQFVTPNSRYNPGEVEILFLGEV